MTGVTPITTCHHPRCQTSIRGYELACQSHWYELPTPLRNRIWKTWRSGDRAAHGRAITETLHIWVANIEEAERPLRCANCKAETILIDTDTDTNQPVCLTCARAAIGTNPSTQTCSQCGAETMLLIAVDDGEGYGPDLCPGCQMQVAR